MPKDALRIEAYGSVDEVNSVLGVCRALSPPKEIDSILEVLQKDLFAVGADLATPNGSRNSVARVGHGEISRLEGHIDHLEEKLPPLKNFILPGGSQLGATLHLARTIARRAERNVVKLSREEKLDAEVVVYLNRLSDLLFVLARYANHYAGSPEQKWDGKTSH